MSETIPVSEETIQKAVAIVHLKRAARPLYDALIWSVEKMEDAWGQCKCGEIDHCVICNANAALRLAVPPTGIAEEPGA